jgi:soluble lytic murein transglycosylase-like protein
MRKAPVIRERLTLFLAHSLFFCKCFLGSMVFPCVAWSQSWTCQAAVSFYERQFAIPAGLLGAIASVESGFHPYALNDGTQGFFPEHLSDAKDRIASWLHQDRTSFDVGCMQLNFRWHGKYFSSPEEMLLPRANVRYAAGFLVSLYRSHGSWHKAVRAYHSSDPRRFKRYSRKITHAWLERHAGL